MPNPTLSSLILPVKDPSTGAVTNVTYDLAGGGSGSGGHTIENASGTALTQRNTMQFGDGFSSIDDSTNQKTVITPDAMQSGDMEDVLTPLPSYSNGYANPTGTIISFMGTTAPTGYLVCDGSTKNIADYSRLANFFLAQFGSKNYFGGNGTTTFGLPDLRGEFLRGTGTNSHTNQGSGTTVGTHQDATQHLYIGYDGTGHLYWAENYNVSKSPYLPDYTINGENSKPVIDNITSNNDLQVRPQYYTSRPTNTSVLYCIKD